MNQSITQSEYHKAINRVVDYIDTHLYDLPNVATLAGVANVSEFHFHRLFKAIIGENVGAYITRLRLEASAHRLYLGNLSLSTLALQCGYSNLQAFSKAFKKHFGVAPSAYKKKVTSEVMAIQTKADKEASEAYDTSTSLKPRIERLKERSLVYIRIIDQYGAPEAYQTAWEKIGKFGAEHELLDEHTEWLGVSFDSPSITEANRCRYYACITTAKTVKPSGEFGVRSITAGSYAIFTLKGSYRGLTKLYSQIYCQWLPDSGYRLRGGISYEKYLNTPGEVNEDELLTEVHIPIRK